MRAYRFDYQTRVYLGAVELGDADRDPRDRKAFLIPGDCTLVAPPAAVPAGHQLVFGGSQWSTAPVPRPSRAARWAMRIRALDALGFF